MSYTSAFEVFIYNFRPCNGMVSNCLQWCSSFLTETLKRISGLDVIKLEFILKLKITRNDWLLADTCPQAANHFALF